jgi:ABC-2 type transport system ATP-binding protein
MNQIILEVQDLVKEYPAKPKPVQAVRGVSFSILEGKCFGILGPNGAGKTTTIEMMEGISEPTAGLILYRGKQIGNDFKQKMGIQFQKTALQDYMTVREALQMFSAFYQTHTDIDRLIEQCDLKDFIDRDTDQLSGGQRQRCLLAIALVNSPEIVFLDEPTTGLDPQARRNFWTLVQGIKSEGKTVILTTHYMEEAYLLCDEILIMDQGKIIANGRPDTLLAEHFSGVAIELPKEDFGNSRVRLEQAGLQVWEREDGYELHGKDVNQTLRTLLEANLNLSRMKVRARTLEDLFLRLTGKELRD